METRPRGRSLMTNRKSRTNDMRPSRRLFFSPYEATSSGNVVSAHKKVSWKCEDCFIETKETKCQNVVVVSPIVIISERDEGEERH